MDKKTKGQIEAQISEAIIDWKGCGNSESRQKLLDLLKQIGFKYKRTSEVFRTSH